MMDEVLPSIFSQQTAKHLEVDQEVVLAEVSKLNDLAITKK